MADPIPTDPAYLALLKANNDAVVAQTKAVNDAYFVVLKANNDATVAATKASSDAMVQGQKDLAALIKANSDAGVQAQDRLTAAIQASVTVQQAQQSTLMQELAPSASAQLMPIVLALVAKRASVTGTGMTAAWVANLITDAKKIRDGMGAQAGSVGG